MNYSQNMAIPVDTETPLLTATVSSAVDHKNRPANRSNSGGWRSASFIIGVEMAERFAYCGISSNLITYLTGPLGQSTATAAENVNTWVGVSTILPLFGAFVADSWIGRYRTIVIASIVYILGLGLLTLSSISSFFGSSDCKNTIKSESCSPQLQVIFFFFSLYLVAVGQGGHKPCVQAFGADQFDGDDPEECKAKSSFFNWWYFCMCSAIGLSLWIITYIQENLNWSLGFAIPCISLVFALVVFLLGTYTYRFSVSGDKKNPFTRIGYVFVAAAKNWKATPTRFNEDDAQCSQDFSFLNKALLAPDGLKEEDEKMCSIKDVKEAKGVLNLIPIWTTCLPYAIAFAQYQTFFTKQGATMDRSIWSGYKIPAASLHSFISLSIVTFIPIYDRIILPLARKITRNPSGITMLQRIGTGMIVSIICMVSAALIEKKRLETALKYGLVDIPKATIPMSMWWLVPQYVLAGISDVFTMVGLQEFFYDQMPSELRSLGLALYLSIVGVGSFLSSFLVSAIDKFTSSNGNDSWFSDNLNRGHLNLFYWVLAGLDVIGFVAFLYVAKGYNYNNKRST